MATYQEIIDHIDQWYKTNGRKWITGLIGNSTFKQVLNYVKAHIDRTDNPHTVTKTQLGLENVTNDAQIPLTQKGAANGVATLGADVKIPAAQMPEGTAHTHDNKIYLDKIGETAGEMTYDGNPVGGSGGSASKWTQLTKDTDFNDQAASTSTITMVTDQTAVILPGMAIKFKLSGTYYYAVCTAITSSLLTIAGAALTTGDGDLTELYYCDLPDSVHTEIVVINGAFADDTTTTLIEDDLLLNDGIYWRRSKAYCVQMAIIATDLDSGTVTTEAKLNVKINGNDLLSSDLTVDETLQNTVVEVNTANYDINFGETIELELATKASGTSPNDDALNLTVYLIFVYP